jgi:hypothetical protein
MSHQDLNFEERAAIMQYDGGLSRVEAEWHAWFIVYGDRIIREEWFEERAGIMEFDGGLSRLEAEQAAHVIVYGERMNGRRATKALPGVGSSDVRLRQPVH